MKLVDPKRPATDRTEYWSVRGNVYRHAYPASSLPRTAFRDGYLCGFRTVGFRPILRRKHAKTG